jgi:hypothetical protein
MPGLIDIAADTLRAGAPRFTRGNLFHAARRARGAELTWAQFGAALRRRLARGSLQGLLPAEGRRRTRRSAGEGAADLPVAVLLVDRPAVVDLFLANAALLPPRTEVVCVDGTPSSTVALLTRGFRAGRRASVLYLHDAATVIYPFNLEPVATLVRHRGDDPVRYADLGLPPLGAAARRFGDPALPADEPVLELEAIPPATLLRYAHRAVSQLVAGDPGLRQAAP